MNASKMIAASALFALGMSAPAVADSSLHHRHSAGHGHHHAGAWTHHRHVARAGGRYAEAAAPVVVAPAAPGGVVGDGIGLGLGVADAGVGLGLDAVGAGLGLAGTGIGIGTGVADAGLGVVDPYTYGGYPADRGLVFGDDLF